jgi:hypothetical protein
MPSPELVFISYSHRDSRWKEEFTTHLLVLQTEGLVTAWDDRCIEAGRDWASEIDRALDAARVAVLLVSAHFLTSRFILTEEIPRFLRKMQEGKLRIMPIILEACLWKRVPWLAQLQIRPHEGRALGAGIESARAQDWTDSCEEIAEWLTSGMPEPRYDSIALNAAQRDIAASKQKALAGEGADLCEATEIAARSSQIVGDSMRHLAAAAAENSQVERILVSFQAEFASASRAIEALTDYKEMHDELHNFEFQCLPRLLAAQNLVDESDREELERCVFDLEATINHIRAIKDRAKLSVDKTLWIESLAQAFECLLTARDQQNSKEIRKACTFLNRVLNTEPSRINDRMRQIAEQLDLGPLTRALTHAESRIEEHKMGPVKANEVRAGITSLKQLETAMHQLIAEHDMWQRLETDLRLIENSLVRDLETLEVLWADIENSTLTLLKDCSGPWAVQLRSELANVTEALDLSTPERDGRAKQRFRIFRRRAGQRFFQVDSNLRESLGKLAKVGEPLLLLLRIVERD